MNTKKKIMQVIFDGWCDEEFGRDRDAYRISDGVIADIGDRLNAEKRDRKFIESEIRRAICIHERDAFMDGLALGIELITGRLLMEK